MLVCRIVLLRLESYMYIPEAAQDIQQSFTRQCKALCCNAFALLRILNCNADLKTETVVPNVAVKPLHAVTLQRSTQSRQTKPFHKGSLYASQIVVFQILSSVCGFSPTAAAQLLQLPTLVRRGLNTASHEELTRLWPTDQVLLHSISSRPGSMWPDAVPFPPSLCLDDMSFQDPGSRSHPGARRSPASAMAGRALALKPWKKTMSPACPAAFSLAVSFKATHGHFLCNLCPRPGHVLVDNFFIQTLAVCYSRTAARSLVSAAALWDGDRGRYYYADHKSLDTRYT
jgi:hypothetical protein